MAERNGATAKKTAMNGTYGNACVARLNDVLAADAIADTIVLGELPGSAVVYRSTLKNAALGASTTISIGYRYKDSADGSNALTAFHNAKATDSAGSQETLGPIEIAKGSGVEIVATVGGGAATGRIDNFLEYEYVGQ